MFLGKLKEGGRKANFRLLFTAKAKDPKLFFVILNEFKKIWNKIEEATIVKLEGGSSAMSFVYDAEKDPVRGEFVHVDFYALDVDKPITADVMIVFEGRGAGS